MDTTKITVDTVVNADAQKVWNYYTQPEHITQWNFAVADWHCPRAENNMRVGGTYKARMEAKDGSFGFDFEAVYSEIKEGKEFTYSFGGRTATVHFDALGDQTRVTVSFDPEEQNPVEMQRGGWQAILNNFKAYVETH
ncbi:MAG: activator of ATPase [Flaviaesturariibacter sp.]|nr:activator of ATPase [Flaviaesturariibacter sp.]